MNNKKIIIFIFLLNTLVLNLIGCDSSKKVGSIQSNINIIETSSSVDESYIKTYSFDGKFLGDKKVSVAEINSGLIHPVVIDNHVYLNSIGVASVFSDKVIDINLANNEYKTYDIAYGIWSITSYGNYVFTSHSPVGSSIISKYNKDTQKIESTLKIDGQVTHINILNGFIYAFSTIIPDDKKLPFKLVVTVIDPNNFKIQNKFETDSDIYVSDSFYKDDTIFFVANKQPNDSNPSKKLYKLNPNDGTISNIELKAEYPYQIISYKQKLLISNYNPIENHGNQLTIVNLETNSTDSISFEHDLNQIDTYNDYLIASDNHYIYMYDLNTYALVSKFSIKEPRKGYKNQGFYISK